MMPTRSQVPAGVNPLYWLRVPRDVMTRLRTMGFHDGYWRDPATDCDRTLQVALDPATPPDRAERLVSEWASFVDREASLLEPGFPAVWHPAPHMLAGERLRRALGNRLVEVVADDLSTALYRLRMTAWNIGVFYHVACTGHWRQVLDEHLTLLRARGLTGVRAAVLGSAEERREVERAADRHGVELAIQYHHSDLRMYEIPAMRLVWEWAHGHDGYVIYFHTKGVGSPRDPIKQRWRQLMNRFVLGRWRENVARLWQSYDAVGVNWQDCPPISHFPGNFWVARTEFLRSLEDFPRYYRRPRHHCSDSPPNQQRLAAEFWIGSGPVAANVFSHVARGERIDCTEFWASHGHLLQESKR